MTTKINPFRGQFVGKCQAAGRLAPMQRKGYTEGAVKELRTILASMQIFMAGIPVA